MTRAAFLFAILCGCLCANGTAFPVKPRTCYEATFRVRVVEGMMIEDVPQLRKLMSIAASRSSYLGLGFCRVQWRFADADGKDIPRPYEGAAPQTLFSKKWKTCRYRFWTPENAARFEIFAQPGRKGDKVDIADLEVCEVPAPETLNFNGDFSADADIPWGWQLVGSALFQELPSGRSVVHVVEDTVRSDLFPVTPGTHVKVAASGSSPILRGGQEDRSTNVRIAFFATFAEACTNRAAGDVAVALKGRNAVAASSIVVPEGKHWARLSAWNGLLAKVEVRELGKAER